MGAAANFFLFIIFPVFQNHQNTYHLLNFTFKFDRCRSSSAAETPIKCEGDPKSLTHTFERCQYNELNSFKVSLKTADDVPAFTCENRYILSTLENHEQSGPWNSLGSHGYLILTLAGVYLPGIMKFLLFLLPKTIWILTKVFCTSSLNLVILDWTGDELSRRHGDWWTHTQTQTMTDKRNFTDVTKVIPNTTMHPLTLWTLRDFDKILDESTLVQLIA